MITLYLPLRLRTLIQVNDTITLTATTVTDALQQLLAMYPRLSDELFHDQQLQPSIRIFHNHYDTSDDLHKPLQAGDKLQIVQAMSGG